MVLHLDDGLVQMPFVVLYSPVERPAPQSPMVRRWSLSQRMRELQKLTICKAAEDLDTERAPRLSELCIGHAVAYGCSATLRDRMAAAR
jgi:hypothetical protein